MIPQEIIDEIKSRTDVLEVIGDFVNLKKNGSNFRGYSPFNNERTPSFYVVPSKGFFKDFSSGKAGDAITFLMDAEGMSYVEAIKHLAKKYGIDIPEEEATDEELEARNERDSVFIVMKYAAEYYQNNLWKQEEGKSIGLTYLRERGFSDETIQNFSLGYSLDQWDGLMKSALEKGYQKEYLAKAGLIIQKEENNREYDRFRGRVMFPVHNISGRVLAFGARILGNGQPKYLNSPETLIYHKSDVLYGLYQAKQTIRQEDNCYLVEGYTDVISLYQAGVRNAVASSGTSLTQEQIRLIGRYTQNVTVLFDSDPAGLKASFRGIDMILEGGLQVKAVMLPEGEDPDSLARRLDATELRTYLKENRTDFIGFKTQIFQKEAETDPIRRAELIKEVVGSIAKVPDPIQRQVYIKATSTQLEIDEQVLVTEMNKIHLKEQRTTQRRGMIMEEEAQTAPEVGPSVKGEDLTDVQPGIYFKEREVIRVLVLYGQQPIQLPTEDTNRAPLSEGSSDDAAEPVKVYDYIYHELEDITIQTPVYQQIFELYREHSLRGVTVTEAWLAHYGTEEIKQEVIDLVVDHYVLSENWELLHNIYVTREQDILHQVIQRSILELKFAFLSQLMDEQRQKLKETTDEVDQIQILKDYQLLKASQQKIAEVLGIVVA